MSVVDMNKWLEVETYFAPHQIPPVIPDSNHNDEIPTPRSKPRAHQPPFTTPGRGYNPTMVVGAGRPSQPPHALTEIWANAVSW
jgi:hypothetical protein